MLRAGSASDCGPAEVELSTGSFPSPTAPATYTRSYSPGQTGSMGQYPVFKPPTAVESWVKEKAAKEKKIADLRKDSKDDS